MPAAVQRIAKGSAGAQPTVSIGAADGWVAPTAGNLLVAGASSDGLCSISPTMASGGSVIDDNAAYLWWKIADGSETTITVTPSASTDTAIFVAEYSGVATVSPTDGDATASVTGMSGTTTNPAAITTTTAGGLIVVLAALGRVAGTGDPYPTALTWSNGFTARVSADTGTTSGTFPRQYLNLGDLLVAGAAGSNSSVASWTNPMFNRQALILAFKAGAVATNAPAGLATGALTADQPSASVSRTLTTTNAAVSAPVSVASVRPASPLAGTAVTAPAAGASISGLAPEAAVALAAPDATVSTSSDISALAELAPHALDAPPASALVVAPVLEGAAALTAPDATVSTSSSVSAAAELAAAALSAPDATVTTVSSVNASAETAQSAMQAFEGAVGMSVPSPAAPAALSAPDATAVTTYPAYPAAADVALLALDPSLSVLVFAEPALIGAAAEPATVTAASDVRPFLVADSSTRASTAEPGVVSVTGGPDSRPLVAGATW